MTRLTCTILFIASCAAYPALAEVGGRVVTAAGQPIEGAVVSDSASPARAVTDARGHFRLPTVDPPATLRIEDPRFESLSVEVGAGTADSPPPVFTLEPKQLSFERVVVTAHPGSDVVAPVSTFATAIDREDLAAPSGSLVDTLVTAAGVAEGGQGGLFQAYSVRGVAGQRVFTTIAGMRIVTERRAGATASFIDPSLIGAVEVVRGPGSTLYGSGALGGVVQALPLRLEAPAAEIGYGSQGDGVNVFAGSGGPGWTAAIARRDAGNGEDGDGAFLFNGFTQWSGLVRKEWTRPSGTALDFTALPAVASDIAKPNTRYPGRITQYPEERHLLLRLGARLANGWRLAAFAHPNDLQTENLRAENRSLVTNEALDWALEAQRELALGESWTALAGVDYFGRNAVTATEVFEDFEAETVERFRTLDGTEGQASVFGTLRRPVGRATFEAGARLTRIEQENQGVSSHDFAETAFVGLTAPLGGGFALATNAGSGLRFPSLSERFFTGATGRDDVIANQDLDPERSFSVDLGMRYFGRRLFVEVFGYRNEISDYIEQVEVEPGVATYVNLTEGTIDGVDLNARYAFSDRIVLQWSGSRIEGHNAGGGALADIPSHRVAVGTRYVRGAWRAAGRFEHRFSASDPGPGEVTIPSANLVTASLSRDFAEGLRLRVHVLNLLDESYLPSADELAVPGPGRSLGVSVGWFAD